MNRRRKTLIIAVAAAAVTAVVGGAAIPRPPQLSAETSGDPALIERVQSLASEEGPRDRMSVAYLDGASVTVAHFGATDDTQYEVGSVTKTFTALLFADAIERGEVTPTTRLGDLLELGDSPAADITLEQLATQSSGLPRLPSSPDVIMSALLANFRGTDPYTWDLSALEDQARSTPDGEHEYAYSNFGIALLGQALAAASGTDYASMVDERIFSPVGMTDSAVPTSPTDLDPDAPTGYTSAGRAAAPWTMSAYAPAGSIRSTTSDMVAYARALLDGEAPGIDALAPRADAGEGTQIGYAWMTTGDVTWHNGMTGGFSSFVGLDREGDRAVIVLSDSAVSVDSIAMSLLEGGTR